MSCDLRWGPITIQTLVPVRVRLLYYASDGIIVMYNEEVLCYDTMDHIIMELAVPSLSFLPRAAPTIFNNSRLVHGGGIQKH